MVFTATTSPPLQRGSSPRQDGVSSTTFAATSRILPRLLSALALCALLAPLHAGAQTPITIESDPSCGLGAAGDGCDYVNPDGGEDGYTNLTGTDDITVTVTRGGYVLGGRSAIHVDRTGAGSITIINSGDVDQNGVGTGAGIRAGIGASATGAIRVTNAGTIDSGASEGIRAQHDGASGGVTIVSSGTVRATGLLGNSPAIHASVSDMSNTDTIDIDVTGGALSSAAPNVGAVEASHAGGNIEISVRKGAMLDAPQNAGITANLEATNSAGTIDIDHAGRIEGGAGIRAYVGGAMATPGSGGTAIDIDATGEIVATRSANLSADALAARGGRTLAVALSAVPTASALRLAGIEQGTGVEAWIQDPRLLAYQAAALDQATTTVDIDELLNRYNEEDSGNAVLTGIRTFVARFFGRLSDLPDNYDPDGTADSGDEVAFDFQDDTHLRWWLTQPGNAESMRQYLFSESETGTLVTGLTTRTMSRNLFHTGDIEVTISSKDAESDGHIQAEGHGVRALYGIPHDENGAIKVTVREGARVVADKAGIFVSGAGSDSALMRVKNNVDVDGSVWGGTNAAIRLGIGDYADEDSFSLETGTVRIGETGRINAGSDGRAIVAAAGTHITYDGGRTNASKIVGDIDLSEGTGASAVTLSGNFRVTGNIAFDGGDNDTLTIDVDARRAGFVHGDIVDLGTLAVSGAGKASVRSASFSGSTLTVDTSTLFIHDHLNLGATGTITVTNEGKIVFASGDAKITAGGTVTLGMVDHDDDAVTAPVPAVHVAGGASIPATGLGELIVDAAGAPITIADAVVLRYDGQVPVFQADSADPRGSSGGGNGNGNGGNGNGNGGDGGGGGNGSDSDDGDGGGVAILAVGGGVLAYLLWDLVLSAEDTPSGIRPNTRGLEYQVRSLDRTDMPAAGVILPASGVAASLRAHLGDGFHAELTGTPNFAARSGQDELAGSRYGLGLGWQAGAFSTDVSYSHATLDSHSTFSNLAGLGTLSGTHGQRHNQLRANARLRLDTAGVSIAPSLSLFGGTASGERYTASSPVWLSDVPSVTQDYSGWKAGLSMAPRSGLEAMGLRWHPELRLTTARLADGGGEDLEILQRDRAGAIRLQTRARTALPRAVHALGGGLTVAGGGDWSLRGGYVAMLADGDLDHAAIAGFRMRF